MALTRRGSSVMGVVTNTALAAAGAWVAFGPAQPDGQRWIGGLVIVFALAAVVYDWRRFRRPVREGAGVAAGATSKRER